VSDDKPREWFIPIEESAYNSLVEELDKAKLEIERLNKCMDELHLKFSNLSIEYSKHIAQTETLYEKWGNLDL
jgi:predicted  nucleic acid-binding Zn-ribbon protein